MNDDLLIDIWTDLKEYFDKTQIQYIASKYVDILVDNGIDDSALKGLRGNDEDLDEAIEYYLEEPDEEDYNFDD